jgi:hypothetical protein
MIGTSLYDDFEELDFMCNFFYVINFSSVIYFKYNAVACLLFEGSIKDIEVVLD